MKREAAERETIKSEAKKEFERFVLPLLEKADAKAKAKAERAAARKASAANATGMGSIAEEVGTAQLQTTLEAN